MDQLIEQIKSRRRQLGLLQKDMESLIGMKQAQYQRLEAGGNIKLKTLERVLKVLKFKILLVPQEKLDLILPLLEGERKSSNNDRPMSLLERYQVLDDE